MHFLEYYYNNVIKFDLINRFNYKNLKNIPKLEKIVLNFGCKTFELKKLSLSLLSLQLITDKKGILTVSKKPNIVLKIRKGNPVGCKVILTKNLILYHIIIYHTKLGIKPQMHLLKISIFH